MSDGNDKDVVQEVAVGEDKTSNGKKKRGLSVRFLAYTAVCVALSALTNIYTFVFSEGATAVSFTYIANFFGGAILGPFGGLITGLFGDLLGHWISPKGDFNFIIFFSSGLMGLIPGVVFYLFRKKETKFVRFLAAGISLVLMYLICSNLNTFGIWLFYFQGKKSLGALFVTRIITEAPVWAVNAIICVLLVQPILKIIKL